MGIWAPGPGATVGNDTFTGDGTDELADGLGGDDTLNGNEGADTLNGGSGLDHLDGGGGDDTLLVLNDVVTVGETYAGGTGTDTLSVSNTTLLQDYDFRLTTISSIERLQFDSLIGDQSTVYFRHTQLGSGGLSSTVNIIGSSINNHVTIQMIAAGSVSLAGWTFTNWGLNDLVSVNGSAGADTINGSGARDSLWGMAGSDTISGNSGDDDIRGFENDDTLSGGNGFDQLVGGDGADTLFGNNDNDTLIGDAGADALGGGAGEDTASYFFSVGGVTVDLQAGVGAGGHAQGDTYTSVERVIGSGVADTLIGRDFVDNQLSGGEGDDILMGRYGGDALHGGDGVDTLSYVNSLTGVDVRLFNGTAAGGEANGDFYSSIENVIGSNTATDTLAGDDNANSLWGGGGNETMTGRGGADNLYGENGNDVLLGGAGEDWLIGALGNDTLGGGADDDTADYSGSNAGVNVNLATGVGTGGHAQGDTLVSIEDVIGSDFNDVIVGKANAWNNVFDARNGDDTITGGLGDDTFIFRDGGGSDTITDFTAGAGSGDVVELRNFGAAFDTFGEVTAAASQVGADVVINFGDGQTLTLQNVVLGSLTSGDFIFDTA